MLHILRRSESLDRSPLSLYFFVVPDIWAYSYIEGDLDKVA